MLRAFLGMLYLVHVLVVRPYIATVTYEAANDVGQAILVYILVHLFCNAYRNETSHH